MCVSARLSVSDKFMLSQAKLGEGCAPKENCCCASCVSFRCADMLLLCIVCRCTAPRGERRTQSGRAAARQRRLREGHAKGEKVVRLSARSGVSGWPNETSRLTRQGKLAGH